jgi:hypothetical protein
MMVHAKWVAMIALASCAAGVVVGWLVSRADNRFQPLGPMNGMPTFIDRDTHEVFVNAPNGVFRLGDVDQPDRRREVSKP